MIDLLFIAMLQAAAGDPASAPAATNLPAATTSSTETPAATPDETPAAPTPPPQQVRRCHSVAVTGSNIHRRVCTTAAEDEANSEQARQALERMQRNGALRPPG